MLDGFAKGRFTVLVANRVLDEGVDVPEAKVAVVIGGQASTRQAKQRLGRVLRRPATPGPRCTRWSARTPRTSSGPARGDEAMLTSEQSIVEYRDGRAIPDRLTQATHRHYREYAERMLAVYRNGAGRQRRALHREVEAIFADEPDCPVRRIQAFCKLLDDAERLPEPTRGQGREAPAGGLLHGRTLHPLVQEPDRLFEHEEAQAKAELARGTGHALGGDRADLYSPT